MALNHKKSNYTMKKTILALMATVAFVACNKDDGDNNDSSTSKYPTKITQITGNTRVERTFELQDATRPKKETQETYTNGNSSIIKNVNLYEYDGEGRLSKKEFQAIVGNTGFSYYNTYHYKADGKLEKEEMHALIEGVIHSTNYEYRADGKLIKKESKPSNSNGTGNWEVSTYDYPTDNVVRVATEKYKKEASGDIVSRTTNWHTYTLDGKNNIVKDEYSDATYRYVIVRDYNDKINPEWADFFIKSTPDYFVTTSRNNVTQEVITKTEIANSSKVVKEVRKYKYENNGDYPIKRITYLVSTDDKGVETEIEESRLEYSY